MECDLCQYVSQLQRTNRSLSKVTDLQLQTISILQERNEQLVDALVLAIKELERSEKDNPIVHILRGCL
jgi:hypothetical protein